MDPSLKETLLDRLSSYLDGLDAADAETAGLAPTAAEAPSADEETRDLFSVFVELAAVRNEARAQARIVKEALDQFRAVFETLQSRACCERRPISPGYCIGARRRRGSGRRAWRSRSDRQGVALTMGRLTRVSPSGAGVTARPQRGVVKVTAVRRCVARHALSQAMFYAARARHSANAAVRLCL
jgi:hypothetical protein